MQVRYQAALRPEPLLRLACSKLAIIAEKHSAGQTGKPELLLFYVEQAQNFA